MQYIASILTASLYLISLTGLLIKPLRTKYLVLLGVIYFLLAHLAAPQIGHIVALFYLTGSIIFIITNQPPHLINIIFSLYGYLLLVMAGYIYTVPLSLLGLSIELVSNNYAIPILLIEIITISLVILILRKLLFRSNNFTAIEYSGELQYSFLFQIVLGISVILFNIIFSNYLNYPSEVMALNGFLISFFVLSTIALFHSSFKILRKNHELTIKQRDEKALNKYLAQMESFYDEIRSFRHDYINIISTLRCYIDNLDEEGSDIKENSVELKKYFTDIISSGSKQLNNDSFILGQLKNMEIPAIKSVLYSKLLLAINAKLHLKLELIEPIMHINIDIIKLSRIVGILLDNSIEAAIDSTEALLHIAIIDTETAVIFSIKNSTRSIDIPVSLLNEKGKSTKKGHNGLGLYNIKNIIKDLSNVLFEYTYDEFFCQKLEIKKEENKK